MIKAVCLNGGETLSFPVSLEFSSYTVRYLSLYMLYNRKAREYTEPIDEAENLLKDLTLDNKKIIIENCESLQKTLVFNEYEIEDGIHREFFVQLCFLLPAVKTMKRGIFSGDFQALCSDCGGNLTRAIYTDKAFMRLDFYSGMAMHDRCVWKYHVGNGGFGRPECSRFAAESIKVYVRDVPAFRDDEELSAKIVEIQERLGENGRIMIRFPSAESFVRVMIEAQTGELCRGAMREFEKLAADKGYDTYSSEIDIDSLD